MHSLRATPLFEVAARAQPSAPSEDGGGGPSSSPGAFCCVDWASFQTRSTDAVDAAVGGCSMRPQWQHGGGAAGRRKSEVLRAGGGGADVGGGGQLRASPSKTRGSRRESLDSEASLDSLSGDAAPHTAVAAAEEVAAAGASAAAQRRRKASLDRGRVEVPLLPIPSTVMETSARRELGLGGSGSDSSSPSHSPTKGPHMTSGFNEQVDGGVAPTPSSDAADAAGNATALAMKGGGGASQSPPAKRSSEKRPRSNRPTPPAMVMGGSAASVSMDPTARTASGAKLPREGTRARDFVNSIDKLKRQAAAVLSSSHTAADLEAAQRASQAQLAELSAWGGSPEKPPFTLTAHDTHHEESVPL